MPCPIRPEPTMRTLLMPSIVTVVPSTRLLLWSAWCCPASVLHKATGGRRRRDRGRVFIGDGVVVCFGAHWRPGRAPRQTVELDSAEERPECILEVAHGEWLGDKPVKVVACLGV